MTSDAQITIGIKGNIEGGKRVQRTLDDIDKSATRATGSTGRLDRATSQSSRAFNGLSRAVSAAGIALAARAFVQAADNFTLLEARVQNSTRSTEEFTQAMGELTAIAAETGSQFSTTVEVFQRLSFVRDEIGASVDQMTLFTANVQKLGVVSGASTQALNAGLTQLGQGLSSGVLRAEEFNSLLENVPAIANTIAKEFGVTTGQLRNLVLEGEVLSEDVFAAILNQSEQINEQFDQFPKTVSRAFNELIVKLQVSAGEINNATGATEVLIFALEKVGQVVDVLIGLFQGFSGVVSAAFEFVIAGIIDGFNEAGRAIQKVINTAISAINKLTGQNIELVDFASDISRGALAEAALEAATEDINNAREGFIKAFESAGTVVGLSQEDEKITKAIATNVGELSKNYAELAENLLPTSEAADKVKNSTNGVNSELERINREVDRFGNKAAETFTDFVTGATDAKSALRSLLNDLLTLFNREFVTNPLSDVFSTVFNPGAGSSGGGGLGSIFSSVLGGFGGGSSGGGFLSGIGSFFGFNSGGSMVLGGNGGIDNNVLSLNGTPIARTGRGETLSINPATPSGGGITINQEINVSTGVQETVQAELVAFLPQIQETTRVAVQEAELRGYK